LPINIPAWFFLGGWFLYQSFERNYALVHPSKTGGSGVAFFAHVGGFIFGVVLTRVVVGAGRLPAQEV
jgi:rhomboid family protein